MKTKTKEMLDEIELKYGWIFIIIMTYVFSILQARVVKK